MLEIQLDLNHFANDFLNQASSKKKNIEELIVHFTERSQLEDFYANSLEKMNKNLTNLIEKNGGIFNKSLKLFQAFQICRCEQTTELSKLINSEIIENCKDFLKEQCQNEKNIAQECKNQSKIINNSFEKFAKVKEKYLSLREEYFYHQDLNQRAQIDKSLNKKTKQEYANAFYVFAKKKEDFETVFKQQMNLLSFKIEEYFEKYSDLNFQMENFENQRKSKIKDLITQYFIFEVSYVRNLQYDSEKILKKLEGLDVNLKSSVHKIKSKGISKEKIKNFVFNNIITPITNSNSIKSIYFSHKELSDKLEDAWKCLISKVKLIEKNILCKNNPILFLEKNEFTLCENIFKDIIEGKIVSENKKDLCVLLKNKNGRITMKTFLDFIKNTLPNPMGEEVYNSFLDIIDFILNECYKHNDIEFSKKLITLSKVFYKEFDGIKYYVFYDLKQENAYLNKEFWLINLRTKLKELFGDLNLNQKILENKEENCEKKQINPYKISLIEHELNKFYCDMSFFIEANFKDIFFEIFVEFNIENIFNVDKIISKDIHENFNKNKENLWQQNTNKKKKIFDDSNIPNKNQENYPRFLEKDFKVNEEKQERKKNFENTLQKVKSEAIFMKISKENESDSEKIQFDTTEIINENQNNEKTRVEINEKI